MEARPRSPFLRLIAWVLCFSLLMPYAPVVQAEAYGNTTIQTSQDTAVQTATGATVLPVYQDDAILIYNYKQLLLIGSGAVLRDRDAVDSYVGAGVPVADSSGIAVTYALDADYRIAGDFALPGLWQIPAGFCGTIAPAQQAEERPVYDADTDTIYIYNPYQLAVMAMDNAEQQPVLSNDMDAETVGMGTLFLKDEGFVTYGGEHNYVLSSQFDATIPEHSYATSEEADYEDEEEEPQTVEPAETEPIVPAETEPEENEPAFTEEAEEFVDDTKDNTKVEEPVGSVVEINANAVYVKDHFGADKWGRDFPGQVLKTINGTQYILIGNLQQLNAIGSGKVVLAACYQCYYDASAVKTVLDYNKNTGKPILRYGGDADLTKEQNGQIDSTFGVIGDQNEDVTSSDLFWDTIKQCSVNQETGAIDLDLKPETGVKYELNKNYIIFREIELTQNSGGGRWDIPVNFTGTITQWTAASEPLYAVDGSNVTIYIYNAQQLAAMNWYDGANTPVHANDAVSGQFGTGAVVTVNGAPLTYDPNHTYVITEHFNSGGSVDKWGRDFPGQVIRVVDGEQYILIGNAEQLKAIGSGREVLSACYQRRGDKLDLDAAGKLIMRYGGDADLIKAHNGYGDFTFGTINEGNADLGTVSGTVGRAGQDQETGLISKDIDPETDTYYNLDCNYIIFRDIELPKDANGDPWSLMDGFTGSFRACWPKTTEPSEQTAARELYDAASGKVYLYNPYQFGKMNWEFVEKQPIYSGDTDITTFGTGNVVGTYTSDLTYIITPEFSKARNTFYPDRWGRDFPGQVIKTLDGVSYILLGSEQQVRAIGTNKRVTSPVYTNTTSREKFYKGDVDLLVGETLSGSTKYDSKYYGVDQATGALVKEGWDTGRTYSRSENYLIFRDIELTEGKWNVPDGFTGTIVSPYKTPDESLPYESDTDTILFYHSLQLAAANWPDAAELQLRTGDPYPREFGIGPVVKNADGSIVTYDDGHNYRLTKYFTTEMDGGVTSDRWGREFPGQVVKYIKDVPHILIGNHQQLHRIGTNTAVWGAVYQWGDGNVDINKNNGKAILRYSGDADLLESQNGYADFTFQKVNDGDKSISVSGATTYKAGVDQRTGEIDPNLGEDTGVKYSLDAQYIIFRDIEMPLETISIDNKEHKTIFGGDEIDIRWALPMNFAGGITSLQQMPRHRKLYEVDETGHVTIYIYHPKQLDAMNWYDGKSIPVCENDAYLDEFGTGDQITVNQTAIAANGKVSMLDLGALYYAPEHTYVLSEYFDTADGMNVDRWGREFPGQVLMYSDGVENPPYIMIGNETQLRKIGSGEDVFSAAFETVYNSSTTKRDVVYVGGNDTNRRPVLLYGGDADLDMIHNGVADYEWHTINDNVGTDKTNGVDQTNGFINLDVAAETWDTGVDYGLDANYVIFRDIELTDGLWNLPQNFTGQVTPMEYPDERELYDAATDTVYVHNVKQLDAMNNGEEPDVAVKSVDAYVEAFGAGDPVLKADGATAVTYSADQKYVVSKYFDNLNVALATDDLWDRDFPGQVVKTISGEQYILIGNQEQLRAIGSGKEVTTSVYAMKRSGKGYLEYVTDDNGNPIMVYPGDADIHAEHNSNNQEYEFGVVPDPSGIDFRRGVNQLTGRAYTNLGTDKNWDAGGAKYTNDANYIIFRDIKLTDDQGNWEPLYYTGRMIGAKADGTDTTGLLWNRKGGGATKITQTARPYIDNVKVVQENRSANDQMGVGFFSTIQSAVDPTTMGATDQALVKNIELKNVNIDNNAVKIEFSETLVSGLLGGVGWLLGGLLDAVVLLLTFGQKDLEIRDILFNLLNARVEDPTFYATGGFAGRVIGDALVEDCAVTGVTISREYQENWALNDEYGYTGGFVGFTEGTPKYLLGVVGALVDFLAEILNVIPFLGLGDLVTILLGNLLPIDQLLVVGYTNPTIRNCTVSGISGTLGREELKYAGGFAGAASGAWIEGCTVKDSTFDIVAKGYGGGFAGLGRDAEITGLLDGLADLGDESLPDMQPQTMLMGCSLLNSNVKVTGEHDLGGFVGALTNSYAINATATGGTLEVDGSADYAGGFTGNATLGWLLSAGDEESKDNSLLGGVTDILTRLLKSGSSPGEQKLLSLAGVAPSAILGCTMDFDSIKVHSGGNYAGGMVGRGDGLIMGKSDMEYISKLAFWKYNDDMPAFPEKDFREECSIDGLESVSADGDYAGGVAGFVGTASAGGLLDNTLGLARFIGFYVDGMTVNGKAEQGYTVTAGHLDGEEYKGGNCASGGFGAAIGGMIDNVQLNGLASVYGFDRVGGFIGLSGPGDLAAAGGLQLSLLGLNILEINNLLAVGQGVEVEITDSNVTGIPAGFTVEAIGENAASATRVQDFTAAGFVAESHSTSIQRCNVINLQQVTASNDGGHAGGFVGTSETGGLGDVADKEKLLDLIQVNQLVNAVAYLIPEYISCTVSYVDEGGVQGDVAGGFVADLQSGTVDNTALDHDYSVFNLDHVDGQTYAGGFGGIVQSGALATAGKGLSILGDLELVDVSIDVTEILGLVKAYVPFVKHAGVYSENGFTVTATTTTYNDSITGKPVPLTDINTGSAGGFIGFASGAQVSYSDVNALKHTEVTEPDDLEAVEAPSYFDSELSTYAVTGGRYAGGYVGNMDLGSAASVGGGLQILGTNLGLTNVLDVLSVVVTTVEHSDVYGNPGGFAVLASAVPEVNREFDTDIDGIVFSDEMKYAGMAGGFAGNLAGGHVQDCNVHNFSHIIGEIAAGGYVGNMVPGNVANVLSEASILEGLVDLDADLLSVAEDFVPTIRNSSTDSVPCGGVVRAQAASDRAVQRGMAGGYVGHNEGGNIWGNNDERWLEENNANGNYIGEKSPCEAIRIRSVYGHEYAGGFTGLMEPANTAQAGGLSLLGGLIEVGNLLGALSVVYPTEENTAVYGPMYDLDVDVWNGWVEHVGQYKANGLLVRKYEYFVPTEENPVKDESDVHLFNDKAEAQVALDAILSDYIYGYHVVAGRSVNEQDLYSEGGYAGGYVGKMKTGTVTNAQAHDAKLVRAMRSAGGFAGQMASGGAAEFGNLNILGLELNLGKLLGIAQVFVPVVKGSSVYGYQSGLTVDAFGTDHVQKCGYAGGFVGSAYGAQIWGYEGSDTGCDVRNLRRVTGTNAIGGYVGLATAATVASVNTNSSTGILQKVLDFVIGSPGELLSVLNATVTTISGATVSAVDEWGFEVDGRYGDGKYANYAGGFAGALEAVVLSEEIDDGRFVAPSKKLTVDGLRSVEGGLYAGGFFGLADVSSVATVSGSGEEGQTSVLMGLIKLGQTDVLSAFRTYIYNAAVNGVEEGIVVRAHSSDVEGILDSKRYMGCAGGFGGGLMNGTVKDAVVNNLNTVEGLNYVGGFIGHMGKNGVVDLDNMSVAGLLSPTVGLLDVFGSHVDDCTLVGIDEGYVVKAAEGEEPVAGGFVGYADVSRINDSKASRLKLVNSDVTAGGFVGMTNRSYLVDVSADSPLLAVILFVVNALLDVLHVSDLENVGVIDIPPLEVDGIGLFELNVMADGNLLYVNLLGIRIGVSISSENGQDRLHIHIGDSEINLNYSKDMGDITDKDLADAEIKLFKGNRTEVNDCSVTGISQGYDVYGAGATYTAPSTHKNGAAGGFIGLNREGRFQRNNMYLCDAVSGAYGQVGPFSGFIDLNTVYDSYTEDDLEAVSGKYNVYRVYRDGAANPVNHYTTYKKFSDWKGHEWKVYRDGGMSAVLMDDIHVGENTSRMAPEPGQMIDPCAEEFELTIQKLWDDEDDREHERPASIQVTISREGILNGKTKEDKTTVGTVTLTAADDGTLSDAVWRKVVTDLELPAAKVVNGVVECYYVYSVSEVSVPGYEVTVEQGNNAATFTLTNKPENDKAETDKYVEKTEDGYKLTLEAFADNLWESNTTTKPADIVLVLDHSASMHTPAGADAIQHTGTLYDGEGKLTASELDKEKGKHLGYYVAQGQTSTAWFLMEYTTDYVNELGVSEGEKWVAHAVLSTEAVEHEFGEVQRWSPEDVPSSLVFYKSQYAIAYDAMLEFAADIRASGVEHRVALVAFSGCQTSYGSGVYVGGSEETFKRYGALHHENTTQGRRDELYRAALKSVQNDDDYALLLDSIHAVNMNHSFTCPSIGLRLAAELLNANPISSEKRDRIVVMFTDGQPNATIESDFFNTRLEVYDEIVREAATLKSADTENGGLNAKIYSISTSTLTAEGDETKLFLDYTSSDYPDAVGYLNPGEPIENAPQYTSKVENFNQLKNIFTTIRTSGEAAMDHTTILREVLSDYFVLDPESLEAVTVYTAEHLGNGKFADKVEREDLHVELSQSAGETGRTYDTVEVSGFDYFEEYISDTARTKNGKDYYGSKLIVEVQVKVRDGFWGGNNVPTNDPSTGLYTEDDLPIKDFPVPEVNVPVADVDITGKDKTIYTGDEISAKELIEKITVNGQEVEIDQNGNIVPGESWMDDFVELKGDPVSGTEPGDYTFEVELKPTTDGTGNTQENPGNLIGDPAGPKKDEITQHVYILIPVITFEDSTVDYGTSTEDHVFGNVEKIEWIDKENGVVPDGVTIPKPDTKEPILDLEYTVEPGVDEFIDDTKVDVTVSRGDNGTDITDVSIYDWDDSCHDHQHGIDPTTKIEKHPATTEGQHEFWVHVHIIKPDTVVIDFGLPVDIDPLTNDPAFRETAPALVGIGGFETADFANLKSWVGTYGVAKVLESGEVRYTLNHSNGMQMAEEERFYYQASYTYLDGDKNATVYDESTITVIPATIIYYEDSFLEYKSYEQIPNYETWTVELKEIASEWTTAGEAKENAIQGTDRPGTEQIGRDLDNLYGYDGVYANEDTWSMGAAQKVTVSGTKVGSATFTFTGTAFDVIALSSSDTGTIKVAVYDDAAYRANQDVEPICTYMVDTYYGYTFIDGKWVVTPDPDFALYQVPVMKIDMANHDKNGNGYGTYRVDIQTSYSSILDHVADGSYDFYLDAIRIYDQANDGKDNEVIEDAYKQDHEGWPTYVELRDMLIDADTFDSLGAEDEIKGIIFIDGIPELSENTNTGTESDVSDNVVGKKPGIKDYANFGPNNELYLAKGQAVSFQLNAENADRIHLALKNANVEGQTQGQAKVRVFGLDAEGKKTYALGTEEEAMAIGTATDLYYDITALNGMTVVIQSSGENIVSVTNIKTTHMAEPTQKSEEQLRISQGAAAQVLAALKPAPVNPFSDVREGKFYYESILWAVENGITSGLKPTLFGPDDACNRAQVVTFLWRAAGSPEPTSLKHSFTDVQRGRFYEKAVLWAVENGITNGLDATHFGPEDTCDRAQVVTFLWRASGCPEAMERNHSFTDAEEGRFYYEAMLWAVENGITNGMSADSFGPALACTRAQVVTFLYRVYAK